AWSSNTALADLPNRTTVLYDLTQLTDHLPLVADYSLDLYLGDANGDGVVNASDATIIAYGQSHGLSGWNNGDFNGDGVVNSDDWSLFQLGVALSGASAPAPEPSVGILVVGGFAMAGRRRRRTA
ncbi:MAG TPA: dockerin type I domain-containing protein, partial [Tepidisphaeraceae bacterium]|nr:dockerin type I domain-containing protein [Tepidisphaeraceae bacterium]